MEPSSLHLRIESYKQKNIKHQHITKNINAHHFNKYDCTEDVFSHIVSKNFQSSLMQFQR